MTDEPLPPPVRHRLADRRERSWTSDLSVAEFAALQSVGLDPVGQVFGTTVFAFTWSGRRLCGSRTTSGVRRLAAPRTMTGFVEVLYQARTRALQRLQDDAIALGADGVVGTRLTLTPFFPDTRTGPGGVARAARRVLELSVVGTAVRARSQARPQRPFVCDLSGQDTAALLLSGWVPTGMVLGVGALVAHDSAQLRYGRLRTARTVLLPRWSGIATTSRSHARASLEADVRRHGGQIAVIAATRVDVHEQPCTSGGGSIGTDHLVTTLLVGTALRRFTRSEGSARRGATIAVLPLLPRARRQRTRAATIADPLRLRLPATDDSA